MLVILRRKHCTSSDEQKDSIIISHGSNRWRYYYHDVWTEEKVLSSRQPRC